MRVSILLGPDKGQKGIVIDKLNAGGQLRVQLDNGKIIVADCRDVRYETPHE